MPKEKAIAPELFEPAQTRETQIQEPKKAQTITIRDSQSEPMRRDRDEPRSGNSLSEILVVFERLAVNPNVNPDALGKLYDLQERVSLQVAKRAFDEAFVKMQPKLPMITKDGHIIIEKDGRKRQDTPYATWDKIAPAIKPILSRYGFSISHTTSTAPDGRLRVTAILRGHGYTDDSCYLDLSPDPTGSKNGVQALGSSRSYGKRYTACDVLNIVTIDEDDDGKASGRPLTVGGAISQEQLEQIVDLGHAILCNGPHLLKHLNSTRPKGHPELTSLENLPSFRFEEAISALRSYEQNAKARAAEKAKAENGR